MPEETIAFGAPDPDYQQAQEQPSLQGQPAAEHVSIEGKTMEERRAMLRAPFPAEEIELLPKYTGKKGPDGKIPKSAYHRCEECGGWHPFPCVHLDYVGHAGITDRLNDVDPEWNWEPLALDQHGLPLYDSNGGLWIRMTVLGVTRYGYGDAQGKRGPNAVKEIIGDAIRNAAMRFGVATYLWSKSEKAERLRESGEQQDEGKEPPAQGPFSMRCKVCGHVHQFLDRQNYEEWLAYWQGGGEQNRCCPNITLEVM